MIDGELKTKINSYLFNKKGKYNVYFIFDSFLSNLSKFFYFCTNLEELDFSAFIPEYLYDMNSMCSEYISLKNFSSFNTENVSDLSFIFYNCSSLREIDLSSFKTNKVKNMEKMFLDCQKLEKINISSFVTNNVTNMRLMFGRCYSLKEINLASFHTQNVKDML